MEEKEKKPVVVLGSVHNGSENGFEGKSEVTVKTEFVTEEFTLPSPDEDGIEVFRFDRNSLKLRCEKVSPKQLKEDRMTRISSTPSSTNHQGKVKIEGPVKINRSDIELNGQSSGTRKKSLKKLLVKGSDGNDDSDSSSSSSCSSSSDSSSSSSSSSSQTSSSSSNKKTTKCNNSKKKSSSTTSSYSSSSSSSSGSSSESSSESGEDASSDDELVNKSKTKKLKGIGKVKKAEGKKRNVGQDQGLVKTEGVEQVSVEIESGGREIQNNTSWGDYIGSRKSSRLPPRTLLNNKNYEAQLKKKLRALLRKDASEWTDEDQSMIQSFPKLVAEMKNHMKKKEVASERLRECEDPPEILNQKCAQLANVISRARYLIIYTGAGISTSAKIPDYRGPNGIWTLLQKGEEVTQSLTDFSQSADPTLTHMAIKELWERGICKHVVSQNVDGLHLRSGIPKVALSEVHGNMYVEACVKCGREFVRLFDVTENTRRHHHKTGRCCYHCGHPLRDTIVLFGEKGSLRWPLNWTGAEYNVDKADVILCLGSSLKVLRRYPWLWCMHEPPQKRPKLYIVNLQWTPKDQFARLKINGKCDEVMEKVMAKLSIPIPEYSRATDAIFSLASGLHPMEEQTKSTSELSYPDQLSYPDKNKDLRNYIRFEPIFKVPVPYTVEDSKTDNDLANKEASTEDTQDAEKTKKRQMNNSSWLGNAVVSKQNKKRKFK